MADPEDLDRRIPIETGFYIKFSRDGVAVNPPCDDLEALAKVQLWLYTNQDDKNQGVVRRWYLQKKRQLEEDTKALGLERNRQVVDALAAKIAKDAKINNPKLIDLIRTTAYSVYGIPEEGE